MDLIKIEPASRYRKGERKNDPKREFRDAC